MPFQICRVCYKRGYNLQSLENDIHRYQYKLLSCVPEIDIYIIDNPGICKKCADMLDTAFELREICLQNEKRYNSTFNTEKKVTAKEKESTVVQESVHVNNKGNTKETCIERNQICKSILNSECTKDESNTEDENLLEIRTECTFFCNMCNIEFTSQHDKKVHDHKLHRQLKHIRKFKELLPPINKNIESILPTTQLKHISSNFESSTNENNKTSRIQTMDENVDTTYSKNSNQRADLSNIIENYVCNKCNITFDDTCEMESHNLTHMKNICQICGKNFETKCDLDDHMRLHFTKCCGESFPTATLLQLHTYKEHNTTCGICDEKFTQFSILFHHLLDHMGDNWHKCNFCGKQFQKIEKMKNHTCKYYTCNECKTIYFTKKGYITHTQIHRQESLKSHSLTARKYVYCSRCDASFRTRSHYVQHYNSIHLQKQKHSDILQEANCYSCQLCSKQYQLYTHLKMHILQIHCKRKLTIPIVDCRKDDFYKEQEGLKINFEIPPKYMEKSTNKFTILKKELSNRSKRICFKCRIMFSSRPLFFSHAKQKHKSCCNTKFTCLAMIIRHNFTHYNKKEREGSHEEITCVKCTKTYKNYASLLSHACSSFVIIKSPIQGKQFEYMTKHQESILDSARKQNNDKELTCSSCRQIYSNYTSLISHSCPTSCALSKQQEKHEIFTCTIEDHDEDDSDTNEDSKNKFENLTTVLCEICKKEFDCKASLLQHIKTHI